MNKKNKTERVHKYYRDRVPNGISLGLYKQVYAEQKRIFAFYFFYLYRQVVAYLPDQKERCTET